MEDMMEKRPERSCREREMVNTFSEGVSLRKLVFQLVELVKQSRRRFVRMWTSLQ